MLLLLLLPSFGLRVVESRNFLLGSLFIIVIGHFIVLSLCCCSTNGPFYAALKFLSLSLSHSFFLSRQVLVYLEPTSHLLVSFFHKILQLFFPLSSSLSLSLPTSHAL